jgi:hypothetical protein
MRTRLWLSPTPVAHGDVLRWAVGTKSNLCSCHRPGGPDRQLQRPAQSGQIGVAGTTVVPFPKIDARYADANLFGDIGSRQATSNTSFAKIASERRLSRQGEVSC